MKRKRMPRNAGVSIGEALQRFQDYNVLKNLTPYTLKYYEQKIGYFIEFVGGAETPLPTVSLETVNDYILSMKRSDTISDVTINVRLRALRAFLHYCMNNGWLEEFEVHMIKAPYPVKEPYTDTELALLLKKPDMGTCLFSEYRDWVIVNFLLSTGCRLGTLIEIKIKDVDFKTGMVYFKHMKARNQMAVPLSSTMSKILQEYIRYRGGQNEDYLFVSETEEQMTPNTVHSSIARYNRRRGVYKTSVHLFRHTFAMKYIQAGGDPFRLQKLLGHSDLTMTRQYVALYADDLKANYDRLNPLEQFKRQTEQGDKIKMKK